MTVVARRHIVVRVHSEGMRIIDIKIALLLILCCTSCKKDGRTLLKENSDNEAKLVCSLDIERLLDDFWNTDTVLLNDFADSVRFIPLELTPKSRLTNINFHCCRWEDHYIVSSGVFNNFTGIISFDTHGRFEESLMEIGHGPTELPLGLYEWCFDAQTRELVVQGGHMTKLYSLPFHTAVRLDFKDHVSSLIPVGDSLYAFIGAMPHSGKTTEPFLGFYDRKGTLIKNLYYGHKRNINQERREGQVARIEEIKHLYHSGSGKAFFKELYNDTIYSVGKGNLIPYLFLKTGKYAAKIKNLDNEEAKKKCFYFRGHGLSVTDRYVFINYIYEGRNCCSVWEKANGHAVANTIINNSPGSAGATSMVNNKHFVRYRTPLGKIVTMGIVGVEPKRMYAIIKSSDAMDFLPGINLESNPVLMEVTL